MTEEPFTLQLEEFLFMFTSYMICEIYLNKTFVSFCCSCITEIYSISSTQQKKTPPSPHLLCIRHSVCVLVLCLCLPTQEGLFQLALREKTVFFSSVFLPHVLWVLSKDLFYRPEMHYLWHCGAQCINSFISSRGENASARKRQDAIILMPSPPRPTELKQRRPRNREADFNYLPQRPREDAALGYRHEIKLNEFCADFSRRNINCC